MEYPRVIGPFHAEFAMEAARWVTSKFVIVAAGTPMLLAICPMDNVKK